MPMIDKSVFKKGFILGFILASLACILAILPYIKMIQKVNAINSVIAKNYMGKINEKKVKDLYNGMFDALDEYSCYYTKKDFKELTDSLIGNYCGIGVVTSYSDNLNHMIIREVYDNTPAKLAGLKKDDEIVAINGKSTSNLKDIDAASAKMKGKAGTKLKLSIVSHGIKKDVEIVRKNVDYKSTKVEIRKGIGYLKIYTFDEKAAKEVRKDVNYLKKHKIKKVILDLRNNPGGLVEETVHVLEDLVPKQEVLKTIDKKGKETIYKMSTGKEPEFQYVLLINEETASSAEIFASVMKNGKYATLVGTPTYGKGVAQSIIPLYDGSGIKVTTEKWYDNKGNSINKKGIYPDIRVKYRYLGEDEFEEDLSQDTQYLKAEEIINENSTK